MKTDGLIRLRASHAMVEIEAFRNSASKAEKEAYVSYIKALPARLRMLGLGQTVVILRSRSQAETDETQDSSVPGAYGAIAQQLEKWLCGNQNPHSPFKAGSDLVSQIFNASQGDYFSAQVEAELYLSWLKKFANALLFDEWQVSQ